MHEHQVGIDCKESKIDYKGRKTPALCFEIFECCNRYWCGVSKYLCLNTLIKCDPSSNPQSKDIWLIGNSEVRIRCRARSSFRSWSQAPGVVLYTCLKNRLKFDRLIWHNCA